MHPYIWEEAIQYSRAQQADLDASNKLRCQADGSREAVEPR